MVSEHPIHPSLSTMTKPTNPPKGDTSKQSHSTSSSLVEVIVEPSTSQSPTEQMLSALQCQLQQLSADMATRLSASEQKVLHQVNEVTNRIHKLETQKAIAGNLPPLGFTCSTSLADTFPSLQQLQAPPPLSTVPPVLPHHIDNTSYFGTPPMTAFHPGTMAAPQDHRPRPHLFNNRLFEWPDRRPDDYDRNTFPVELDYQSGFGNHFSSEAIQGALPRGQNSPLECPYSLYTEQISGTSFTVPRKLNQCSWLYRVKPSVTHEPFSPRIPAHGKLVSEFNESNSSATPTQLRWKPMEVPESPTDFIDGLFTVCGAGSSYLRHGFAIHMYSANKSMEDCAFCSADGDFLVVPQDGRLWITTECGRLQVSPGEIVILPQGFRFAIDLPDGPSKGYVAETFGTHFQLPDLGPIGANGLAASRDFVAPVAWFEHVACPGYTIVQKFGGELFTAKQDFSPFNVVAWHGNYVPYKYDLSKFCPYNTVLFDHSDPSVNTVLTAPTDRPGLALLDFVIFPPRWVVAEHTFRPPYYHRNCMSEFMGLIYGGYEAKADGFLPGGASLHSCMSPHGPDTTTYEATIATGNELVPKRLSNTMAFMFETCLIPRICPWALQSPTMDHDYYRCWIDLKSHFTGEQTQAAQNDAKLKE